MTQSHFVRNRKKTEYLRTIKKEILLPFWPAGHRKIHPYSQPAPRCLIIGTVVAIEFTSTTLVQDKHLRGLLALKEEGLLKRYLCVSLDEVPRQTSDGIEILPWETFLRILWAGELF